MKLLTAQQMRELDRLTIEEYGIPGIVLMENAGIASFEAAMEMLEDIDDPIILVLCGPGNNGGDGYVVARHLYNSGASVHIAHIGDLDSVKGDARTNMLIASKMGIAIHEKPSEEHLWTMINDSDLVVDALLGTGTSGPARSEISDVISMVNSSCIPVLALDIPSGIDVDRGQLPGESILADVTITFGLPKVGMVTYPAAHRVGKLIVAEISIPSSAVDKSNCAAHLITQDRAAIGIPDRSADSHKGTFGHLAVAAGSIGMSGAVTLSAFGGLRIGTGLVTMLVPESINPIVEIKVTEAMSIPIAEGSKGKFGLKSRDKVLQEIGKRDALVLGPGIGRDDDTVLFVRELLESVECPVVLDADALYAVSKDLSLLKKAKNDIVLTPHPGEMAMLLGTATSEVQSNRLEVAIKFALDYGVTLVLKGAGTVVASPNGTAYINPTGCSGMASGGVGDVLSGMIGGLLAQDVGVDLAAVTGVYLHGLAGELASDKLGEAAMLASDLVDHIGESIQITTGEIDN